MPEHPNAAVLRQVHAALTGGDLSRLTELIAEDAVRHVPGHGPFAGDYLSDEFVQVASRMWELSGGTINVELHDTVASDEHAVNLERITATRESRRLDIQLAVVCHVRDGKLIEAWDMFSDTQAWDDFWS
jgi:uncharacterized protein